MYRDAGADGGAGVGVKSNQIKNLFRNNNKNTLYMYMSNQNKKVLLRGGHMAHNVTPKHKLIKYRNIYTYTRRITKSLFLI